jgi:hypothetical protein
MLDSAVKLIEYLVQLAKRREEQDKNYYVNFVAPAFADFESLHKHYLESFGRYLVGLRAQPWLYGEDPFFHQLRNDILFVGSEHAKIVTLLKEPSNPEMTPFIAAIGNYVNTPIEWSKDRSAIKYEQGPEYVTDYEKLDIALLDRLRDIGSPEAMKEWAISILNNLVAEMQRRYALVVEAHSALKRRLLLPK